MRVSALFLLLLATSAGGVTAQPQTDESPGQERLSLKHSAFAHAIAFSPDGKQLASAGEDGTVKVWDASTGNSLLTMQGHTKPAVSVTFSPDGKRLASASDDKTVIVWDADTGQKLLAMDRHAGMVQCVAFSPNGTRLASASEDKTVRVWDSTSGRELLNLQGHTDRVQSVVFSPDGKRLASGGDDDSIIIWDADAGKKLTTLRGHDFAVTDVTFSRDGELLASASWDHTARIWDASTGKELHILKGHVDHVYGLAFRYDGKRLASASRDGWVKVWDTSTGQILRTLTGRKAHFVLDVAYSPDGKQLASAGNAVRVWTLERPNPVTSNPATKNSASSLLGASRTWTNSSGQFKVKAKFIRVEGAFLLLQRDDNQKEIRVPLNRLSRTDLALLQRETNLPELDAKTKTTKGTPEPSPPTKPDAVVARRDNVLALAGFNHRQGLETRRGRPGPYQLDALSPRAGTGEYGWSDNWTSMGKAIVQTESVFEGDGALHLEGTASVRRSFAGPLTDTVEIEHYVSVPAGGHVICYIWENNHASTGPMWSIEEGKFLVLAGDERGSGEWTSTGESAAENEWIRVVVEIDTGKRRWKLKLPDKDYASDEFKYRGAPKQLLAIQFLAETKAGIFIDAIQIRHAQSE